METIEVSNLRKFFKFNKSSGKKYLPTRARQDNKSNGGKCLVIAGSAGMWGSAVLAATAAARSGAGYVYLNSLGNKFPVNRHPDFLSLLRPEQFDKIGFDSVAIGPGLKDNKKIEVWIRKLIREQQNFVVLDAQAIHVIGKMKLKNKLPPTWIVTPHEGELAKLLNITSQQVRQNRIKYVELAQESLGCIVLLKGNRTLVADNDSVTEIQSGNPALAKAGTGDVLTGIILAFLAQGVVPQRAACLGAYIHGLIADRWVGEKLDVLGLMASDLVRLLPEILFAFRHGKSKAKKAN